MARDWHNIVQKIGNNSKLLIINDGSKDNTYEILVELQKELPCLEVVTKENSGHGATIWYGYQYAINSNASYIFQTDADGQTSPDEFWGFWNIREEDKVIIGFRKGRLDGFSRKFVTKTLKLVIKLIFGVWVKDANTPFRLISNKILSEYLSKVPENFNLTNVLLTIFLVKKGENVVFLPITFLQRQGGVNSINMRKICLIGYQAIKDFKKMRYSLLKE